MAVILLLKSAQALSRPYQRIRVWLILEKQLGLPEDCAQRMVGQVLHDTYPRTPAAACPGQLVSGCSASPFNSSPDAAPADERRYRLLGRPRPVR